MSHSRTIVHEFGFRCYLRCIWRTMTADHPVTFLECAAVTGPRRWPTAARAALPAAPIVDPVSSGGCPFDPLLGGASAVAAASPAGSVPDADLHVASPP
jgi:hypothetical protein